MHLQINTLRFSKYELHYRPLFHEKIFNSSLNTASSGIYSKSLNGMPLILTLLENGLPHHC